MPRTHTVTIAGEVIDLRVPLTARQRLEVCGEWWEASSAFQALVKRSEELSATEGTRALADVQAGIGAALSRLAPEDHPWRQRIRDYAGKGHQTPALAAGLDLVDEMAEAGIDPDALAAILGDVLAAVSPAPSEKAVSQAEGN